MILLVIILVLLMLGSLPNWNHSQNWGPIPSSMLGMVLVVLLILMVSGRI